MAASILIWLIWIDRPDPPNAALDPSWQATLGYAHEKDLLFGREIIFTHGPWGWLASHYQLEPQLAGKRMWETGGKLFLVVGTALLVVQLPLWRRIAFLVLLPAAGLFFPDTHYTAMIMLAVLLGLMRERPRGIVIALVLLALGFLSTMKFIYAVLGMSGVALAIVRHAGERQWRTVAALALGAPAGFFIAWFSSGQPLEHLSDHFRMSLELSMGYGAAMGFDEPLPVFLIGAFATLVFLVACALTMRASSERWRVWPAAAYLAFATFVMWKHGFSRADGHVFALFNHAMLIGVCAAPALGWRRKWDPFLAGAAAGVAGVFVWNAPLVSNAPMYIRHHIRSGSDFVLNPDAARAGFRQALAARQVDVRIPQVTAAVGDRPIDAINYHQGVLLLNNMNYVNRPIIQSYSAYTVTLLRRNWRFIQLDRAPEFLLWKQGSIDGRFPSLDDSLLLTEIPRRYEPVRESPQGLLVRRRAKPPAQRDPIFEFVSERGLGWGETMQLPQAPETALWLEVDLHPSMIGKLRAAIYKPGQVRMIAGDSTLRQTNHRIIPGMAATGFLIHPFLESQTDISELMHGRARLAIRTIRFEPARPDERELWSGIHVRLYRMPEIPLELASPFSEYEKLEITDRAPTTVSSEIAVEIITHESPARVLVHPPGEMTFTVEGAERCLTGSFGIREGAYTGGGATDGVTFTIQAEDADGTRTPVWTRTLRPTSTAADRGMQQFEACAPDGATRLILSTTAGDHGNADWDWSYWAELRFRP